MKRWIAFALSAALLGSLSLPAMAEPEPEEETADVRLARVTESVKNTLDLDTDEFTDFYGDVSQQELGTTWSLRWTGDSLSLNVEALEDGTVVGYWRNDNTNSYRYSPNLPAFPKGDVEQAKAAASDFFQKVLDPATESVKLDEFPGYERLNRTSYSFYGQILLNGLPSPLSFSMEVRSSDNVVTNFYRDAPSTSFLGNIPSATPAVSRADAEKALRTTRNLELIYVTSEEDDARAVLRYVPKDEATLYVDAQTGELVEPGSGRYRTTMASGAAPEEMEMAADADNGSAKRSLNEVELSGVAKMEGVLDANALDGRVRNESAYQLGDYTLVSSQYRLVKDDGEEGVENVLCTMRYSKKDAEDPWQDSRTFTVNARTGEVRSLWGNGKWDKDRKSVVTLSRAQEIAQAFLGRFTSTAAQMPLYATNDTTAEGNYAYNFTFARKVNGYFYPSNTCVLSVDRMTGAICGVQYNYDRNISFEAPRDLVSADAAMDAWMGTFDVKLAYRYLDKSLNPAVPLESKLIDAGYTQFYSLLLSYALETEDYCPGIDAKTGEPVVFPQESGAEISYDDIAGDAAEAEIARLAAYGIGYDGGAFRPAKDLTQWDAVCLLASTSGWRLNPEKADDDMKNSVYETAYRMGALTREERNENAVLTRGDLVKLLLNSAGYGAVANLSGIFTCPYTDSAEIPAADMGYAALASGFGLASGIYAGSAAATRADAAQMLCRLMERDV